MKLLLTVVAFIALVAVTKGEYYTYSFELRVKSLDSKPFDSNATVELNFDDRNETFVGDLRVDPSSWWSFYGGATQTVDRVKSIRFKFVSDNSADDTFVMDEFNVGQHYFRNRYIYFRSFTIDGKLEQNKWYTGYPNTRDSEQ